MKLLSDLIFANSSVDLLMSSFVNLVIDCDDFFISFIGSFLIGTVLFSVVIVFSLLQGCSFTEPSFFLSFSGLLGEKGRGVSGEGAERRRWAQEVYNIKLATLLELSHVHTL